ncbi:MAG TPA: POTRA domain-containing protein [Myxococcota bacterium]|nr:POTRA domain-containing protein [Myxococcota bacterium]
MRGRELIAVLFVVVSFALARTASADDAGASTFASGERLYRTRKWTMDEIPVPARPVARAAPEVKAPNGPVFAIRRFEIVGNTLLPRDEVDKTLAPYVTPKATFDTIEQARDALQQRYASDGFIAVAVGVPPQTVESGSVRLDVAEARIGNVTVENEGQRWISDARVRALTPHIQSGAILRESDLRQDLTAANTSADRIIRPVLTAGKQPGIVDVKLIVDDQAPVHASVNLDNDRTPGSPHSRLETNFNYNNLWDLDHALGLTYITSPTDSSAVLIGTANYSAPMPWNPNEQLMGYWAYSDTFSNVPLVPGLGSLGNGQSFGLRYNVAAPDFSVWEKPVRAGITAGVDYKDIHSTLRQDSNDPNQSGAEIKTPIRYLPFLLNLWTSYTGRDDFLAASVGDHWNYAGLVSGGSSDDFRANRSANNVDGNYHVMVWTADWRHRLSMADGESWLANLSQSALGPLWPHTGIPPEAIGLFDDWALSVHVNGQLASQPLIPTEQYAAGGVSSVRGYLQSEIFGDSAWAFNIELWTRRYSFPIGAAGYPFDLRPSAFWDHACMHNLDPGEGEKSGQCMSSVGLGLQLAVTRWFTGQLYLADPLDTTPNTTAGNVRLHFRLTGGF